MLEVLWDNGEATVRQLAERLYSGGGTSQNATVQKLLERLESKGCVRRNRESWPHLFRAAVDRSELIGRHLQSMADRLCNGSIEPLLTHLVQSRDLSTAERASLRELLDDPDTGRMIHE